MKEVTILVLNRLRLESSGKHPVRSRFHRGTFASIRRGMLAMILTENNRISLTNIQETVFDNCEAAQPSEDSVDISMV